LAGSSSVLVGLVFDAALDAVGRSWEASDMHYGQ